MSAPRKQNADDNRDTTLQGRMNSANDNSWVANDNDGRESIDESFNKSYAKAGLQPQGLLGANDTEKRTREQTDDEKLIAETEERLRLEALAEENQRRLRQAIAIPKTIKASGGVSLAESAAMKAVSRSTFFWMCGWHFWQWITFQLVLATISIAFLGLAAALDSTWWGRTFASAASAINSVTTFVGLNLSALSPTNMFLSLHMVTLGLLWLSVIVTICIYIVFQHKALSGKATGLKYGAVLIALIGYALPVANLIPWIFIYIFVMKRYPR